MQIFKFGVCIQCLTLYGDADAIQPYVRKSSPDGCI